MDSNLNSLSNKHNVFLNRNFIFLFSSKIISQLGDQIYAFALSWFILDLTKSSFQMSIFLVIDTLVIALISPFGGVIADRINRKKIMVLMDIIRGIIVILMTLLMGFHMIQIWMLYISAIFLGFCSAIFNPAAGAIIPNIVTDEELNQATSLNQMSWTLCALIGMVISGYLYNKIGIIAIFIINGFSFLLSGIITLNISLPVYIKKKSAELENFKSNIKKVLIDLEQGFQYIKTNKLIYNLIIMYAVYNIVVFPLGYVYFPYIFNVILKATSLQLALSTATIFLGMTLGSLSFPYFQKKLKFKLRQSIFLGLLVFTLCQSILILTLFSPLKEYLTIWNITIILSFMGVVIGFMTMLYIIPTNIIFQRYTSDEFKGRFWGFYSSLTSFSLPVAIFIGGILTQSIPMIIIIAFTGIMLFALNMWITNLKVIKELKE